MGALYVLRNASLLGRFWLQKMSAPQNRHHVLLVLGGRGNNTQNAIITDMKIQIITLFPDMFTGVLGSSMLWKAQDKGIAEYQTVDLRQFGLGQRRTVDDTPYGGGDGMLLRVDTLVAAIEYAKEQDPTAKFYCQRRAASSISSPTLNA